MGEVSEQWSGDEYYIIRINQIKYIFTLPATIHRRMHW